MVQQSFSFKYFLPLQIYPTYLPIITITHVFILTTSSYYQVWHIWLVSCQIICLIINISFDSPYISIYYLFTYHTSLLIFIFPWSSFHLTFLLDHFPITKQIEKIIRTLISAEHHLLTIISS